MTVWLTVGSSAGHYGCAAMADYWDTQTYSEDDTIELGRLLGAELQAGDTILLTGSLGSGKTRLAKGIVAAAACISPEDVVSPTFTLVNSFDGPVSVHHADLYRIDSIHVEDLGLDDYLEDGALVIEWADRLADVPQDALRVTLFPLEDDQARAVTVHWRPDGSWPVRVQRVMEGFQSAHNRVTLQESLSDNAVV